MPDVQKAIRLTEFIVSSIDFQNDYIPGELMAPELQVGVHYSIEYNNKEQKKYRVHFKTAITGQKDKLLIKLECFGYFEANEDIDEDFKRSTFIKLNSPAIAFPFIRSYITTITANAGIKPVIIPAFTFNEDDDSPEGEQDES